MTLLMSGIRLMARTAPERVIDRILASPSGSARLLRLVSQAAPKTKGLQPIRIVAGPIAGLTILADWEGLQGFWLGTFEFWVQQAIRSQWRAPMHLWDVGAFNGFHTLVMRKIAGASRVIAIEPDPSSRDQLDQNLKLNGFDDVIVLPWAVGERSGRAQVQSFADKPSQTTIVERADGDCKMVTLDDLLEKFPSPGLVKMDIEGEEARALAGAAVLLRKVRPVWILETHGAAGKDALEQLRIANYDITKIDRWIPAAVRLVGGGSEHFMAVPSERNAAPP